MSDLPLNVLRFSKRQTSLAEALRQAVAYFEDYPDEITIEVTSEKDGEIRCITVLEAKGR